MDRATFAAALAAAPELATWTHYPEPPEQLAGGPCIVVAPRSPYMEWSTFTSTDVHVAVSLLVPRTAGYSMDVIDAGLVALRGVLVGLDPDIGIAGVASVGIIEDVGAVKYTVASMEVTLGG